MSKSKSTKSSPMEEKEIIKTSENNENKATPKIYGHLAARIVIWLIFLGIIGYLWIKPEIIQQIISRIEPQKELSSPSTISINQLEKQINSMQSQLKTLSHFAPLSGVSNENIKALNNRISNFEKQNIALMETKADKETIMGIINRLDRIEERLNN